MINYEKLKDIMNNNIKFPFSTIEAIANKIESLRSSGFNPAKIYYLVQGVLIITEPDSSFWQERELAWFDCNGEISEEKAFELLNWKITVLPKSTSSFNVFTPNMILGDAGLKAPRFESKISSLFEEGMRQVFTPMSFADKVKNAEKWMSGSGDYVGIQTTNVEDLINDVIQNTELPVENTIEFNINGKEYTILAAEQEPEHMPGYKWIKIFVKEKK